ncbi:MAG TPA: PAS domain S-box protein [Bacteroidota bacterium]|nr:PAS domain S-box protein [Bacteroidota bacterium]
MKPPTKRSAAAEEALRESRRFLRQIIDLVPHFVFAKDEQSKFLLVNKAVADAYGTTVDEAIGKSDTDFSATPEEARRFHEADLGVIRGGEPRTIPAEEITDARGNVRYLQTTKIPFEFGPGKTPSILGVSVDITDLIRSEQRLQESEEKYRNLVERAHDGFAVIQDGIVKYLNPVLADFFGAPIDHIIGKDFLSYVHPEERPKLAENYRLRLRKESVPSTYDTILLGNNGGPIPVEINAGRIQYEGKSADLVIIRDTRERKKGEEAVARRDAILKIVRDAAEQFLKLPDPESTMSDLLKRIGRVMRVDHAYIFENAREPGGSVVSHRRFSWTSDGHTAEHGTAAPPGPPLTTVCFPRWQQVLSHGEVLYGCGDDFPPDEREALGAYGIASLLAVPIFAGPDWRGFIGCDDCRAGREWSLLETEALQSLASILGAVLQRRRTEHVQHALYRIAQAAGTSSGIDELCRSIHGIVADVIDAKNFYVALQRDDGLLTFPYFVDEFDDPPGPKKPGKGLTEYVLRSGTSLLCTGEGFIDIARRGEAELIGKPAAVWLGVPLKVEEKVIGVMVLQHYSNPAAYGEQEKQVLDYVSSQIARAIDRKRADEALVSQTAYFTRLFEDGPAGIALIDRDDRVVQVNRSFQKMFGYGAEEIHGLRINDMIAPAHLLDEASVLSARSQEGETISRESVRRRKDGTLVHVNITGYPIMIGGKHVGIYGMYEDISNRKALEAQVMHAQKMESIGTLAGGVAHDFNNLLAIILGNATLLERVADDPRRRSASVAAITRAAERAAGVVRQLLTFARKTERRKESVRVNDLVQELLKFLAETFPKNIEIRSDLMQSLPSVISDATQLHQVLMNICVNARDAMPRGGTLTITTRVVGIDDVQKRFPAADAPSYVLIRATDTGTGMDEATRRRIFEPFFSTKGPGRGSGLGLAVVFGIVESNHGFIHVESSPGEGSCFSVYLPVPPPAIQEEKKAPAEEPEPARGTESILVVEDEEPLAELLQMTLEGAGYSVMTASEGDAALDLYRRHRERIALVVSDVGLPKMSGDQLFLAMKELNPRIKTVLASGYMEPALKSTAMQAGVKAFIQKPYEMRAVLNEIRRVLDAA